jgi:hypothetical protein
MLRLTALLLFLVAPLAAQAVPVEVRLTGFGVSCDGASCASPSAMSLNGSLFADLDSDRRLTGIYGSLAFRTLGTDATGSIQLIGGTIDMDGDGDPGSIASTFDLADGRTLYFPDGPVLGPANRFDGTNLYLFGSTGDPLGPPRLPADLLIVGLIGRVYPGVQGSAAPIPEPVSTTLLAAGALLVGTAVRRKP